MSTPGFVDTIPNADALGADGDRAGRGRGRRRRSGRDRGDGAAANGSTEPSMIDADAQSVGSGAAASTGIPTTTEGSGSAAVEGETREGNARRRGGRGRNRRDEREPRGEGGTEREAAVAEALMPSTADVDGALKTAAAPTPVATAAIYVEEGPLATTAVAVPRGDTPPAPSPATVAPTLAPTPAPVVAAVHAPTATALAPAAAPAPVAHQPYVLATDALQALAQSSGLTWVHSDVEKVRAVQVAIAATPAPMRAPRVLRPSAPIDHGPLVLVETRKDLSQLKLPFDSTPPL